MSVFGSIPRCGSGRIALALLAVVPAAMAYPWRTPREQWVLGVGAAVVILLLGWWRGLHLTTILRRRVAVLRRNASPAGREPATAATAVLRVGAPADESAVLPLPLIAGYLDRYGIRADKIRITNLDNDVRDTWISLTISAVDNLAALRARSERIPLHETAQVAARRLADHLRETGWEATTVGPDDVPRLLGPDARETWRGVQRGTADHVAAYSIRVDESLPGTLDAIRAHPARETYTALEIAGDPAQPTVASACALATDAPPAGGAPLAGLTPQRGNHLAALTALELQSAHRLDGHTRAPAGLLAGLSWPTPAAVRT